MTSHDTTDAGLRCPCCNQRFPADQTGWQGRCWKCLGFASPEDFAAHRQGQAVARKMPPTKPPANPLEAEIADTLVKIEGNYVRETSGYGSRFEGERLEVVQARWAIRRVRATDDARLNDDEEFGQWHRDNVEQLDEIDEDMTHAAVALHYLRSFPCVHCGVAVVETPSKRDTRHDHCGSLPHTGASTCQRCE